MIFSFRCKSVALVNWECKNCVTEEVPAKVYLIKIRYRIILIEITYLNFNVKSIVANEYSSNFYLYKIIYKKIIINIMMICVII